MNDTGLEQSNGPQEDTAVPETSPEEMERWLSKTRKILLALDNQDDVDSDVREQIEDTLDFIQSGLQKLEEFYGKEDPDLQVLRALYEDLSGDFQRGENVEIDTTYDSLFSEGEKLIEEAGVVKNPEDLGSSTELVESLNELGINYDYVVTAPGNDHTVILFSQIHPNPGISEEILEKSGIRKSQSQIEETVKTLFSHGVSDVVLCEGIPSGYRLTPDSAKQHIDIVAFNFGEFAHFRLARDLGDDISVKGYEDPALLASLNRAASGVADHSDNVYLHDARGTSGNILLGTNISSLLQNGHVESIDIGAAHEMQFHNDGSIAELP